MAIGRRQRPEVEGTPRERHRLRRGDPYVLPDASAVEQMCFRFSFEIAERT